jgi:hypothetical protein
MIVETTHLSLQGTADELNRRGLTTAAGKPWFTMSVIRVRKRLGLRGISAIPRLSKDKQTSG